MIGQAIQRLINLGWRSELPKGQELALAETELTAMAMKIHLLEGDVRRLELDLARAALKKAGPDWNQFEGDHDREELE